MIQVLSRIKPRELTGRQAIIASLIGAAITAGCSKLAFYLPGNPVPVSMQVFAVLCCGIILGSRLGALAQIEYLVAGLLGAPVFTGIHVGPLAFVGPTAGYLLAFVPAAFLVGYFIESVANRSFKTICTAGFFGVAAIYTFGTGWLAVWMAAAGCSAPVTKSWMVGAAPFIGVDAAKATVAALIFHKNK